MSTHDIADEITGRVIPMGQAITRRLDQVPGQRSERLMTVLKQIEHIYVNALTREIDTVIAALQAEGTALDPNAIADAIMKNHSAVTGKDAEFFEYCAREEVKKQVRRRLGLESETHEDSP